MVVCLQNTKEESDFQRSTFVSQIKPSRTDDYRIGKLLYNTYETGRCLSASAPYRRIAGLQRIPFSKHSSLWKTNDLFVYQSHKWAKFENSTVHINLCSPRYFSASRYRRQKLQPHMCTGMSINSRPTFGELCSRMMHYLSRENTASHCTNSDWVLGSVRENLYSHRTRLILLISVAR